MKALRIIIAIGLLGALSLQSEETLDHPAGWAFQPVRSTADILSANKNAGTGTSQSVPDGGSLIDFLLEMEREKAGVSVAAEASPGILLRRVYLDLAGYPPSWDAIQSFTENPSEAEYLKIVDQLLSSPQYGERLGRRFLDIWRYADWYGLGEQLRNSQKHIWRWREYVVDSLNADKGYDQMIVEMLAADELYPGDWEKSVATGFLARNYYLFNRDTWLDDTLEHTFKAFLGLTLNCAKCHDHKYDPISQKDYYQMRAFFEPHQARLDPAPGELNYESDGLPRVYDAHPETPTFLYIRGDTKNPDTEHPLSPALPAVFQKEIEIHPINLPAEIYHPGLRDYVLETQRNQSQQKIESIQSEKDKLLNDEPESVDSKEWRLWDIRRQILEASQALAEANYSSWMARRNADEKRLNSTNSSSQGPDWFARQAHLAEKRLAYRTADLAWLKGRKSVLEADVNDENNFKKIRQSEEDLRKSRQEQERVWTLALKDPEPSYTPLREGKKAPEGPDETAESQALPFPSISTGRRLALAQWMASKENPLTARVAVNHLWTRHFGRPLVPNVFDFGNNSPAPTHPDLLDALADEFMQDGWSLKNLTRRMVTSQAYRLQSSNKNAPNNSLSNDPENRFYWRMNPVRMQSQAIRDSLLTLSDEIDWTLGGPPVEPQKQAESRRRGLYLHHSRDDLNRFQVLFDEANVLECYRREESIVPQQALGLVNSRESESAAQGITRALQQSLGEVSDREWIQESFIFLLGYAPTEEESVICEDQLSEFHQLALDAGAADPVTRSRTRLVHALLNHNDFITRR